MIQNQNYNHLNEKQNNLLGNQHSETDNSQLDLFRIRF